MASAVPSTAGDALDVRAWLLLEKRSTFYAAKWRCARARLTRARLFPPPARPQVLLTLDFHEEPDASPAEFVLARAHAGPSGVGTATDGRVRLPLEVRAMADVRTAQRFLTSAPSQMLDLFMDAADVSRVLAFLAGDSRAGQEQEASSQVAGAAPASELIDDAFAALERAQAERGRGKKARALTLFRDAERAFSAAERLLPDERSRGLIASRRSDLERSIAALEIQITREERAASAQPPPPPPPPPPVDVLARLEELRRFVSTSSAGNSAVGDASKAPEAAASASASAALAPAPMVSELATRLAALRNGGKAPAATGVDELAARLQRLRGVGESDRAVSGAVGEKECDAKAEEDEEQVQRVIQQATEELALGIVDDLDAEEDDDGLSFHSSSSSPSSSSTSDDGKKDRHMR